MKNAQKNFSLISVTFADKINKKYVPKEDKRIWLLQFVSVVLVT